jgi:hypothetical protein
MHPTRDVPLWPAKKGTTKSRSKYFKQFAGVRDAESDSLVRSDAYLSNAIIVSKDLIAKGHTSFYINHHNI